MGRREAEHAGGVLALPTVLKRSSQARVSERIFCRKTTARFYAERSSRAQSEEATASGGRLGHRPRRFDATGGMATSCNPAASTMRRTTSVAT